MIRVLWSRVQQKAEQVGPTDMLEQWCREVGFVDTHADTQGIFSVSIMRKAAAIARDVVLIIPGLDGNPGLLQQVADQLFPGRRIVYFDHQVDRASEGLEGMADRAMRLLDQAAGRDATALVCGESFGGAIALVFARRYPARVSGLVLLSTFGWYPTPNRLLVGLGLEIWRLLGDRMAHIAFWLARPVGLISYLGWRPSWSSVRAFLASPIPEMAAVRAKCLLILSLDARPWLAELTCPTFVMTGSFDPVVPVAAGRTLATSIPGARLCRLPGSHVPHLANPVASAKALSAWLKWLADSSY